MKNIFAFFFGVLLAASLLLFPYRAHAAYSAVPAVAGYSASTGTYSAAAGSFAANASSYGSTGIVNVGAKSITVPASLRMASNAGQIAKSAMRLNPYAIAGTLAAGWLLDQGLEYLNDEWQKSNAPQDNHQYCPWSPTTVPCYEMGVYVNGSGQEQACAASSPGAVAGTVWVGYWLTYCSTPNADWGYSPVTPEDWDSLPDPLPLVSPELPYAPYMPNGAPVDSPEYDFAPFSTPLGDPYTKPDNSTAQPMAKVSPNGDSVTIDTYDQPLTDPSGAPLPDAAPVDTAEPAPEQKTDCDKYPNSLGCIDAGTLPTSEIIPRQTVNLSFAPVSIPGNAQCPAPDSVSLAGHSFQIDYGPVCYYAEQLNPFVLAIAYLSAAFIIFGLYKGSPQ